jgi:hypothetical protein
MTINQAINLAIKAIHKVKPSIRDAHMDDYHLKEYEKWMEVIRILESLKD